MHQYIRKLLYTDLTKVNVEKILRQFRKLNWEDEAITAYAIKCFIASYNVRYYNIRCVANLLSGLSQYRDAIAPRVIDGVLEDIRIGLEINLPKYNQRRVSTIRFLGELYNYRLVESAVIFNVLYSLITFGVFFNRIDSDIDPPENLFRVKSVCVLLETCGHYFNSGSSKKKLDCFITYFQHYFWYKKSFDFHTEENPFPITIDYFLKDTLSSIRPKLKFYQSFEDAYNAVVTMERELYEKIMTQVPSLKLQMKDPEAERMENNSSNGLAPIQEIAEDEAEDTLMIQEEMLSAGESDLESEGHSQDLRPRHTSGTQDTDGLLSASSDNGCHLDSGTSNGTPDFIIVCQRLVSPDTQPVLDLIHKFSLKTRFTVGRRVGMESPGEVQHLRSCSVKNRTRPSWLVIEGMLPGGPKHIQCAEDEDFMTAFDKMLAENIQQRNQEPAKAQVDISVPMHVRTSKKVQIQSTIEPESPLSDGPVLSESPKSTINFVLMTRKGNKPQYKNLEVPLDSELVTNLKDREKVEKAEKERVKRLTLDINERQEEEDYQEMLASLQRPATICNLNRERGKPKFYQHPKGAPDADAIFGNR
ncbi:Regulator of nonsense transcripts 2 [Nymphon striatum]|nr:Regulator of nonsense transcripts 2 [Nymphon striatum]